MINEIKELDICYSNSGGMDYELDSSKVTRYINSLVKILNNQEQRIKELEDKINTNRFRDMDQLNDQTITDA